MHAWKSACSIAVIGVFAAGGVARADEPVKISKDGQTAALDCRGQEVVIMGSRNQLTLRGGCAEVDVKGSDNTIRIESADKLELWGSRNTIEVVATNKIQAAGDDNKTTYVRGLGKKRPATKSWGKRNTFKRVAALPAVADAPAGGDPPPADPAPKTGDAPALRDAKPIVCERNDSVTLDGVVIRTAAVAVTTQGNCRLTITNSKIVSTGTFAIATAGSSIVTLDNVEVEGKPMSAFNAGSASVTIRRATLRGTLGVQGSSTVRLEASTVHGGRNVTSSATFVDGGGNRYLR